MADGPMTDGWAVGLLMDMVIVQVEIIYLAKTYELLPEEGLEL